MTSNFEKAFNLISKKRFFQIISVSLPFLFILLFSSNIISLLSWDILSIYIYFHDLNICIEFHYSMPAYLTIIFIIRNLLILPTLILNVLILMNYFRKKENKKILISFYALSVLFFISTIIMDCIILNHTWLISKVLVILSMCLSLLSAIVCLIYKPTSKRTTDKVNAISKELLILEEQIKN